MVSPFRVTVYDGAFARRGTVGNPVSLAVTPRHNGRGVASLVVSSDHHRLPDLLAKGARAVIEYDDLPDPVLTGRVRLRSGRGPALAGQVELTVHDDIAVLWDVLGWPVPGSPIGSQGTAEYDRRSGPAESVLKAYATANAVTRLGLPLTVAPDQGRGASISGALRMHSLADRLLGLVDAAGIGVTVRQVGAGLTLDCYVPALYPRTLSERSAVVQDWQWTDADPQVTRVIVGGQGEGTARTFREVVDTARETAWFDKIEVFRDARDADTTALLDERAAEALSDGAPKAGLSLTLAETATFRYGKAVRVGDRVPLEVGPGVVLEDVLRECVLSWTRDGGLSATPVVGERSDDPDLVLARAVAALGRAFRNQNAGR